jgi:biotin carboxylase
MNVVMLSPGYPAEMAYFTRALAGVGARVIGVGDQPPHALPEDARRSLAHYEHVNLADESSVLAALRGLARHASVDQVECLWEPYMLLAARIREEFGLPGLTVEQTVPFRDKEHMKRALDAAGVRTPWHVSTGTVAGVWEAAEKVGYPLIVKPIAGAGSADTYRVDSDRELTDVLPLLRHVPEVSVEEFVDGEEFTFDTICADGQILFEHVLWYRPRPLQMRMHEWVSPASISLRDLSVPHLEGGRRMGRQVLAALGFRSGFTHMEWYLKHDGEAVFGEIGARPPGARVVDVMNFATDGDTYAGWAQAVVHGSMEPLERRYNAGAIFKRARGAGHITHSEGFDALMERYGQHVALVDLLPVGAPRRDWRSTVTGDGMVVVRHPELQPVIEMAEAFARDFQMYAG